MASWAQKIREGDAAQSLSDCESSDRSSSGVLSCSSQSPSASMESRSGAEPWAILKHDEIRPARRAIIFCLVWLLTVTDAFYAVVPSIPLWRVSARRRYCLAISVMSCLVFFFSNSVAKVRPETLGVVFGKDWEAREVSDDDGLCLVIETSLFERVVHLVLPAKQGKLNGRSCSDEVSSLDKSFGNRQG